MKVRWLYETDQYGGITIIFMMIVMPLFFVSSCGGGKKEFVDFVFDKETSYKVRSTDVFMFVSDSGITKYRMEAKEWLVFDEATEPYWYFPEKIYGEQFDSLFNVVATFSADTAYNYTQKNLWKFVDNVVAVNEEGEQFETSLLFLDRTEGKIYSDRFIRITKGDFINTGTGFEANENLTKYKIFNATAEIPFQENEPAYSTTVETPPAELYE